MITLLILHLLYSVALLVALSGRQASSPAVPGRGGATAVKRILVVGASGGTGRAIVAQALERGYVVTAFVRNPSAFRTTHANLSVVEGDVLDRARVAAAVAGQDAVVSALGHKRFLYPTRILSEGTRNVLDAMESAGVRRFVCQTSLGIGHSAGRMGLYYTFFVIPLVLPFYFWDKTRQERVIADSRSEWVIVRPSVLTNAAPRGTCRHGRDIGRFLLTPRVSRADVAGFMLDRLTGTLCLGETVGVSS